MFYEFEFFQPLDFLEFSNEIYGEYDSFNSMPSAVKRTVINRIYYSIFLYVREWLIQFDDYSSTIKDHSEIPKHIISSNLFQLIDAQFIS